MEQTQEHIEEQTEQQTGKQNKKTQKTKKRSRIPVIIAIIIIIPVLASALAFGGLGAYLYYYNDGIMPDVSIGGTNVSWLTRGEALGAIDVQAYDERGAAIETAIVFPDGSELKITGSDVGVSNDARLLIDRVFSRGRDDGFITDTISFLHRMYSMYALDSGGETYSVGYSLDTELLRSRVSQFTQGYNTALENSVPLIYSDKVVIVKGAGQVRADESDVYAMALDGLLESLSAGRPVKTSYALPEASVNVSQLASIRRGLIKLPLSAQYDPETKTISESAVGVDIDYNGAVASLGMAESGKTVTIDVVYTQPEFTREYMQEYIESLPFLDTIGECVTQIAGTSNRLNNIILASDAINGLVLEPGEEFSFNNVVGRRTSARGYKSAPAFSGGEVVQAIGGGICQVSSTIYSAIKDTGIKIKERHAHGRPVTYLPRGRDATVSWGTLDFKFVNNTEYPLRVDIEVEGRTLTVKVFGTLAKEEPAESVEAEITA